METTEKSIEVLNDLIEINNDRVAGFTHAAKELGDQDPQLSTIFIDFKNQSRENVHQLGTTINKNGGEIEMGMSGSGAIHRMWLDVKTAFSGHDRKSILEECERGEDAIKKAYERALDTQNALPPHFIEIILNQQQGIIAAHNRIKALRDSED
ncbi:PA2169 family four-helix-bundle protein [Mucilaginibacter xinganensis]|uniref:Aldehyde dehydrogenase n=1 Tax=Mucilaginibacter xinganensis TaxID=1234841 RepID=A0A223P313_9SPHI|nr:PA2169 family four-helix-bundle protein [Mucilaginibacter xinganensis]ASU36513.1 aldehyde dehydrogenase [Mucilaginibacter xinganensis]